MNLSKETLCTYVNKRRQALLDDRSRQHYRCHEFARWIAPQIRTEFGCSVVVKDGLAYYTGEVILGAPEKPDDSGDPEWARIANLLFNKASEEARHQKKLLQHSWCEVDGRFVVDFNFHINLTTPKNTEGMMLGVEDILLINEIGRLPDGLRYYPTGFSLPFQICGRTVVFTRFPRFTLVQA